MLRAIERGVTVIDSGSPRLGASSDAAMGAAIRAATTSGRVRRVDLKVIGRGGLLPEAPGSFGEQVPFLEERYVRPGLFEWGDLAMGEHCLHPRFLRWSMQQRLQAAGLERYDLYLLDGLELQRAVVSDQGLTRRLQAAFHWLEQECREGRVGAYGVARATSLQLETIHRLAVEAGGPEHHLRWIELPISVRRLDEVARVNQQVGARRLSTYRAAGALSLSILAVRAIEGGRAEYDLSLEAREALGAGVTDAQIGLQWCRSLPGVRTALVGMSRVNHVEENLEILSRPKADPETAVAFIEEGAGE